MKRLPLGLTDCFEFLGQPFASLALWTYPEHFVAAVVHFGHPHHRKARRGEDSGGKHGARPPPPLYRVPPNHFGEHENATEFRDFTVDWGNNCLTPVRAGAGSRARMTARRGEASLSCATRDMTSVATVESKVHRAVESRGAHVT